MRTSGRLLVAVIAVFAALAALEAGLVLLLRRASAFGHLLTAARRYYHTYEVCMVQYLAEMACYDPRLAYRLRRGRSVFANRERARRRGVARAA